MNNIQHLSQLTGLEIRALSYEQINAWTPLLIQQLTPFQLQALTSTQLKKMRPELIQAFSTLQRSVFSALQLQALMIAVFGVHTETVPVDTSQGAVDALKVMKPVPKKCKGLGKKLELEPSEFSQKQIAPTKEVPVVEAMFQMLADGPEMQLPQFKEIPAIVHTAAALDTTAALVEPAVQVLDVVKEERIAFKEEQIINKEEINVAQEVTIPKPVKTKQKSKTMSGYTSSVKEQFSLTRSAVYMGVVALFSSGSFLVGAYSQENDLLNALWEAHQKQAQSDVPQTVVTMPVSFKEEAVEQHALGTTMPPGSATATTAVASGLVLPPESATFSTPKSAKTTVQPVAVALPVANVVKAKPASEALSKSVFELIDAKLSQLNSLPKPAALPTVQIASLSEVEKKKQVAVMSSLDAAIAQQAPVIERYINQLPRNKLLLASMATDRDVVRLSQAAPQSPVQTPNSPRAIPATTPPAVSPAAESRMREVSNVSRSQDPDRYNAASWTNIKVSTDLPQKIAELGEDLISVVVSELPEKKNQRSAMPFDEFKLRVKEAVVAYPDVGVVESQLGQSQASKSVAFASMLPQVSGTADTGKRNVGRDPYLGTSGYSRNGTNYGVTVSQLLFDFGSSLFGFRAGEARTIAAKELLNSKRSEQALKSINAFIELERAKAQLALAKQNAASRLSIVKLVKERSQIGGGSIADIVRVESKYAEALSTITLSETRLNNAESAYREAFGVGPKGVVTGPLHEFPIVGLNKTAEELAGTYPGLLQLAKFREATQSEYNGAVAKTLPSFQLVYNNSIAGMNAPSSIEPARSNSIVFQLKYEFYTGGADTARKTDAMYKAQQALQEFESGMRSYQKVLSQSQSEMRNSEELISSRKAAANSAIDSMRAVREQFSFNKGSLLDLITVQEGLFSAGRDLIDAMADRALVRYRLLHLTAELDKMFELNNIASLNARD